MSELEPAVGIVGAGPVGLVVAARLAGFGIPSVILEADPHLRKQGSKACLIQGDVLEVLDKFGCAEQVGAEGVTWHIGHTYVRNQEIRRTVHPRPIGYGPFVNISQFRIEQVLLDRVESDPLCQVWWDHAVTELTQDADGVTVTARTAAGPRRYRFRYVIGCDGVRSTVRDLLAVAWTGYSHKDRFLITDIRAKLPFEKHRHFHYDPSFNPGRQLVIHPQPDDIWRIDWQLPPDADIEAERRSGAFERRVRAVIGDIPYEVDWLSTYRFHQRVVDQFRVGRVFLAGDAAHALPPYGSRGMNSGIQDADNLAWKLALVVQGRAGAALLDTYHPERYAAAKENLRVTEATIRFMVPPSLPRRLARALVLRMSQPLRSMRRHVNSGRMAEPFVYHDSPIVDPPERHPLMGRFAPDGWVEVDGHRQRLRRLFGNTFVGLYLGAGAAASGFAARVQAGPPPVPLRVVALLGEAARPDGPGGPAQLTVAADPTGQVRAAYHAGPEWLLIRPDGHVGAAGTGAGEFSAALRRCAGCPAPGPAPDPAPATDPAPAAGSPAELTPIRADHGS